MKAIREPGSVVYAFGAKWGPEKRKVDKYFRFLPGNGIHDIHMNQGNSGNYKGDNCEELEAEFCARQVGFPPKSIE